MSDGALTSLEIQELGEKAIRALQDFSLLFDKFEDWVETSRDIGTLGFNKNFRSQRKDIMAMRASAIMAAKEFSDKMALIPIPKEHP